MPNDSKQCTKCLGWLPAMRPYFSRDNSMRTGLKSWCKDCVRDYRKSDKGKAAQARGIKKFLATEKGIAYKKAKEKRYNSSEYGKAANKRRNQAYVATIEGYLRTIYLGIRKRCDNPKRADYMYYGGRGIQCLFTSAEEFINYVVDELQVDPRDLECDRIDNDGNYEPGNIRFVTHEVNMQNSRCCHV